MDFYSPTIRKWAKSTLVLVPLFGVHYTIYCFTHTGHSEAVEVILLFCDQLFASFQVLKINIHYYLCSVTFCEHQYEALVSNGSISIDLTCLFLFV